MAIRDRVTNILLYVLAGSVLADVFIANVADLDHFVLSTFIIAALVYRARLDETQPLVLVALGLAMAMYGIGVNHGIKKWDSGGHFVLVMLSAFAYVWWEKIHGFFRL